MIKAIIFDIGGGLVNFSHRIVCEKLSKYSNWTNDEIYDRLYNDDIVKRAERGEISKEDLHDEICKLLGTKISFDEFKIAWIDILNEKKETVELVYNLKNKYMLLALSNVDELNYNYVRDNFNALKPFDDIVLSFKFKFRKPNKEIYEEAIRLSKCNPNEIVFIDDLKENVNGAKKLGVNVIQYNSLEQTKNELIKLGVKI